MTDTTTPTGRDDLRAAVEALADEARKRKAAFPDHPHWSAWDYHELDLRDALAAAPSPQPGEGAGSEITQALRYFRDLSVENMTRRDVINKLEYLRSEIMGKASQEVNK